MGTPAAVAALVGVALLLVYRFYTVIHARERGIYAIDPDHRRWRMGRRGDSTEGSRARPPEAPQQGSAAATGAAQVASGRWRRWGGC